MGNFLCFLFGTEKEFGTGYNSFQSISVAESTLFYRQDYLESSEERMASSVVFMHEEFENDYFKQFFDQWKDDDKHQHSRNK